MVPSVFLSSHLFPSNIEYSQQSRDGDSADGTSSMSAVDQFRDPSRTEGVTATTVEAKGTHTGVSYRSGDNAHARAELLRVRYARSGSATNIWQRDITPNQSGNEPKGTKMVFEADEVTLGGILLGIIKRESIDFMSTILKTETSSSGDIVEEIVMMNSNSSGIECAISNAAPYISASTSADDGTESVCLDSVVLSAHASLLLHVIVDDSVTLLIFEKPHARDTTPSLPNSHLQAQNRENNELTCPGSVTGSLLYSQYVQFMTAYSQSTSVEKTSSRNGTKCHWIVQYLPRQSWWLPSRLLSAFAALQGKVNTIIYCTSAYCY